MLEEHRACLSSMVCEVDGLVAACEQTVTAATAAVAGCLAGLVDAVQVLSSLVE